MTDYLKSQFGLTGKRALVTGAGRGIGRAIAEALAGAGAEVLVHYNSSELASLDGVTELFSGKAWSAGADLTNSANVHQLFETLAKHWDSLDILVNNAGDLIERRKVAEFSDDLLDRVMRLNFNSALYMTRAAIPLLRRGKNPNIINLSSVAAHNGGTNGASVYAASKGAIHTWTRGLARELAPEIRVNGIAPGVALTDFHRKHTTEDVLAQITSNTALKRLGTAEDHGAAAVFLAGQGASFITGEVIEINGGLWLA